MSGWKLIDDVPIANTIFDVIAKYYDPCMDRFLMQRFTNCIQVNGEVVWCNPFERLYSMEMTKPIKLTEFGYRPTHWMDAPDGPPA